MNVEQGSSLQELEMHDDGLKTVNFLLDYLMISVAKDNENTKLGDLEDKYPVSFLCTFMSTIP